MSSEKTQQSQENQDTIFLVAGGTGGHIFPAEALSEELSKRGYNPILITDERFTKYIGKNNKLKYEILPVKQVSGTITKKLSGLFSIFTCYIKSLILIKKYKPKCAIGFGGYPSFPTMLAACGNRKIKTIIHEQNSLLGRANEMLADKIDLIATSFPEVSGIEDDHTHKVRYTGNPVRPAVQALRNLPYPDFHENSQLNILVTGGSQGASIFSKVIPDAIKLLPPELQQRLHIEQQCRKEDIKKVNKIYDKLSINAELKEFFSDLPERMATAHIIISRSGASTLTEIAVAGRPAIMVPLPNSKDNHQMVNANSFEDQGIGWVMPQESFTGENLSKKIEKFFNLDNFLLETAKKSKLSGIHDADKKLADIIEDLIS